MSLSNLVSSLSYALHDGYSPPEFWTLVKHDIPNNRREIGEESVQRSQVRGNRGVRLMGILWIVAVVVGEF